MVKLGKPEDRKPKSERNPKTEARKSNGRDVRLGFRASGFFRVSTFGFRISFCNRLPPVAVVSGTRAFTRHHGRAERMFRGAARAEGRAFVRFDLPLQNQAAETFGGFVNVMRS